MNPNTVSLPATLELNIDLTDEQFFQLCQNNRDLRFERTATGELIIMPPTGSETGERNAELTYQLRAWSRQNQLGKSFDSSTGFKLPLGAERSPDASWVKIERWNALTKAEKERFAPLCPTFRRSIYTSLIFQMKTLHNNTFRFFNYDCVITAIYLKY